MSKNDKSYEKTFQQKFIIERAQIVQSQATTSAQNMIVYQEDRVKATAHGKSSENNKKSIPIFSVLNCFVIQSLCNININLVNVNKFQFVVFSYLHDLFTIINSIRMMFSKHCFPHILGGPMKTMSCCHNVSCRYQTSSTCVMKPFARNFLS